MKKLITGFIFVACAFTMVGWGSTYNENNDRDKGDKQADKKRQGNFELTVDCY